MFRLEKGHDELCKGKANARCTWMDEKFMENLNDMITQHQVYTTQSIVAGSVCCSQSTTLIQMNGYKTF